jgi:hypothetical protein
MQSAANTRASTATTLASIARTGELAGARVAADRQGPEAGRARLRTESESAAAAGGARWAL